MFLAMVSVTVGRSEQVRLSAETGYAKNTTAQILAPNYVQSAKWWHPYPGYEILNDRRKRRRVVHVYSQSTVQTVLEKGDIELLYVMQEEKGVIGS